jgi:threonylcarbamoyladenosine tRNA methylthiotransferase MtaB
MREHPRSHVILAGCYPQIAPEAAAAIPGLAGVVGTDRRAALEMLKGLAGAKDAPVLALDSPLPETFECLPVRMRPGRIRAFLKVQEGCPGECTYCVVPGARGSPRSRPFDDAMEQARRLVDGGARELVLTGIQLGLYGKDAAGQGLADLAHLVLGCLEIPGLVRLRLSSVEPPDVTPRLLEAIAGSPKVCPHLHVPLQSGSDAVLRRMGRPYDTAAYRRMADEARRAVPELALSADVIAGFPGETEGEFGATMEFVRSVGFMRLHVFPYSRRPGTPAAALPGQIPAAVREERSRALIVAGRELALAFHRRLIGRVEDVLLERDCAPRARPPDKPADTWAGFVNGGLTRQYVRAEVVSAEEIGRGELVPVTIETATAGGVTGRTTAAGAGAAPVRQGIPCRARG